MDDYVFKPIDPALLLEAINRLINREPARKREDTARAREDIPSGDTVIFNRAELLKRVGGDEDLSRELVEMFLEEFPHRFDEMKQALEKNDAPLLARVAHTIKGSSANISAHTIREAALEMEIAVRDRDLNLADNLVRKIEGEFEKLRTVISGSRRPNLSS